MCTIKKSDIDDRLKSYVSANVLCNYMRKIEFLQKVLTNMAFKPRYFEEKLDYLNLTTISAISFPMTCFCDIPFSKVSMHTNTYGRYGIALDKNALLNKNLQPIMYINPESDLCKYLSSALEKLILTTSSLPNDYDELYNYVLSQLLYTKPLTGVMERTKGTTEYLNFKDECEWRYIPDLPDDFPLILKDKYNNDVSRQKYSNGLSKHEVAWLKFDPNDIRYIIMPNKEEADHLIEFIMKLSDLKQEEKYRLIRKIEILDFFAEDLV